MHFMMKSNITILVILLCCLVHPTFAQKILIKGAIIDHSTHHPIPYTILKGKNHPFGTLADSSGNFQLYLLSEYMTDSLILSAIGYQDTIIALANLIQESFSSIPLNEVPFTLPEIVITDQPYQSIRSGNTTFADKKKIKATHTGQGIMVTLSLYTSM